MLKKIFLFALIIIACQVECVYGQVAVKTNVASDVLRIPSLGAEVGVSPKLSLELFAYYNPWKYNDNKQYKMLVFQPELKYWFCGKFNGHYVGVHAIGGAYNVMGIKPPFGLWSDMKDFRYKGRFYGGGLSYGYQFILNKHWNAEASVGLGYAYVKYRKYPCEKCGTVLENSHKNYLGPTKAALNLVYLF